jgi:hypothetical protein
VQADRHLGARSWAADCHPSISSAKLAQLPSALPSIAPELRQTPRHLQPPPHHKLPCPALFRAVKIYPLRAWRWQSPLIHFCFCCLSISFHSLLQYTRSVIPESLIDDHQLSSPSLLAIVSATSCTRLLPYLTIPSNRPSTWLSRLPLPSSSPSQFSCSSPALYMPLALGTLLPYLPLRVSIVRRLL